MWGDIVSPEELWNALNVHARNPNEKVFMRELWNSIRNKQKSWPNFFCRAIDSKQLFASMMEDQWTLAIGIQIGHSDNRDLTLSHMLSNQQQKDCQNLFEHFKLLKSPQLIMLFEECSCDD